MIFSQAGGGAAADHIEQAKALIFDLDGTLYDAKHIGLRFIAACPLDIRLIGAERQVRRDFAGSDFASAKTYYAAFFDGLSRQTGRHPAFLRQWYFDRYMAAMIRVLKRFYHARTGTTALFEALHSAIPFAVYSDYPLVDERLQALGIDPLLVDKRYGPEDFGAQKPAARPFRRIAEDLGCEPAAVLVVGDRDDTDGAGAGAAGMRFVLIRSSPAPSGAPSLAWEEFRDMLLTRLQQVKKTERI
jgi:FMN phosphatase YigB (HAD superfamily)